VELQRPSGEVQFFEKQTAAFENKLAQSEAELVRFARDRDVAALLWSATSHCKNWAKPKQPIVNSIRSTWRVKRRASSLQAS